MIGRLAHAQVADEGQRANGVENGDGRVVGHGRKVDAAGCSIAQPDGRRCRSSEGYPPPARPERIAAGLPPGGRQPLSPPNLPRPAPPSSCHTSPPPPPCPERSGCATTTSPAPRSPSPGSPSR